MTHSLEELRSSLGREAESFTDHEGGARPAAVRRRIALARRRRTAGATGGLVLALILGLGGFLALRSAPELAVFGQPVPPTLTSLGYTYHSTGDTSVFDRQGTVTLAPSKQPRLLSWTTDRPTTVHVTPPGGNRVDSTVGSFRDFVLVPAGQRGRVLFRVDAGRVAVATYTRGGPPPAGVTKAGITFRQTVAGQLLAAVIGDLGQGDVSTSYVAPAGQVRLTEVCSGLPRGAWLHVSFNGHDRVQSDCSSEDSFDPGAGSSSRFRIGRAGSTIHVRAWVTSGVRSSTPLTSGLGGLRIGVGVYGPVNLKRVAGAEVPETEEYGGHRWSLWEFYAPRGRRAALNLREPGAHLLTIGWTSSQMTEFAVTTDGDRQLTPGFAGGRGGQSTGDIWIPAGTRRVVVEAVRGHPKFGIGLYHRTD